MNKVLAWLLALSIILNFVLLYFVSNYSARLRAIKSITETLQEQLEEYNNGWY